MTAILNRMAWHHHCFTAHNWPAASASEAKALDAL